MRNPFFRKVTLLSTLFAAFFAAPSFAQAPSLAPSDTYYVTAKTEFGKETFTVIRDGRHEEQFYFVPSRPHIAVETKNNKTYPVFQLLAFQRKQADDTLKQGGILQMSVQMGVSEKTQTELLNTIKGKFPLSDSSKTHRLSPIPMKEAYISMYDLDGSMLDSAPIKEGVAPIFGNQQFPFMLNLTDLGTDVMEALCSGRGGLPVIVTYTFQGMTPPGGFKIEVNWDNCYKHFSTDTDLRAKVAYAKLGANLAADFSTIREEMISNGMMKVTSLTNEALSETALDAAMNPIISLITSELFENIKAPPQISPAAAKEIAPPEGVKEPAEAGLVAPATAVAEAAGVKTAKEAPKEETKEAPKEETKEAPKEETKEAPKEETKETPKDTTVDKTLEDAGNLVGKGVGNALKGVTDGVATSIPYVGTIMKVLDVASDIAKNTKIDIGASFALKDAQYVKKGTFTYTFDRQAIVDRKTSFGGPIGIGSFDKKIQEECKTVLPPGNWEAAYYMLPSVGDPSSLGFKEISIEVTPSCGDNAVLPVETAFFNKGNNGIWTNRSGKEVSTFLFPLKAIYASEDYQTDPANFKFKIKTKVVSALAGGSTVEVDSEAPMFDGSVAMAPASDLVKPVLISADSLSFGDSDKEVFKVTGTLKAGNLSFPIKLDKVTTSQGFLIPKDAESVKIVGLKFIPKSGKGKVDWALNNKELKDLYPNYDISFYDEDWQKTVDADSVGGMPDPVKK